MKPVRNRRNKQVVEASRLHRARTRKQTGLTLLEGPHLLAEALKAGADIADVFALEDDEQTRVTADSTGIELALVDETAMKRLADTTTPRGPVAVVRIPEHHATLTGNTVVCWGVGDPGNVGAIIRTAAAFDWSFAYTEGTADPWSPRVLRSAAGNQFHLAIGSIEGLPDLRKAGLVTVATVVEGGVDPETIGDRPLALLIGEEAPGLPEEVVRDADHTVTISMHGVVESLNASVAAGILLHALSKHSGQGQGTV